MSSLAFSSQSLLNLCAIKGQRSCSCSSSRESRHPAPPSSHERIHRPFIRFRTVVNNFFLPKSSILLTGCYLGHRMNRWTTFWVYSDVLRKQQPFKDRLWFPSWQSLDLKWPAGSWHNNNQDRAGRPVLAPEPLSWECSRRLRSERIPA